MVSLTRPPFSISGVRRGLFENWRAYSFYFFSKIKMFG